VKKKPSIYMYILIGYNITIFERLQKAERKRTSITYML